MKKKVFAIVIALITMLCCLLCGCKEEPQGEITGKVYDLKEAYEQGMISKRDVQEIADKYNENMYDSSAEEAMTNELGKNTVSAIKEAELKNLQAGNVPYGYYKDGTIEDMAMIGYYGRYGKQKAVVYRMECGAYVLNITWDVSVADITLSFCGPQIRVFVPN